jgi:hypothetical protein
MEPVMDVEKVPKQRWKLVSENPINSNERLLIQSDMLHLPAKDGSLRTMWQ